MASPREVDIAKTYYHGTPNVKAAKSIRAFGIKPPSAKELLKKYREEDNAFMPVPGRVYITPHLRYAIIYALDGDVLGYDQSRYIDNFGDELYGYLFVFDGKELGDIQPDEDSIGELLYKYYRGENKFDWLAEIAEDTLTDDELQEVKWGDVGYLALAGKAIVNYLSDKQKYILMDAGAHVANEGKIKPSETWRIAKSDSGKLKEDGSNFFEVATKINSIMEMK